MKFNPFKKIVTGLAVLTAGTGAMAEKAPATISENPNNVTSIETPEIKTDPMNNADVVSFAASQEHEMKIKKLEQKKTSLESELQKLTANLESKKSDFSTRYAEVLAFLGKKKGLLNGFSEMLANKVIEEGKAHVGGKGNIVSTGNIEGLKGVLLSGSGEFGKQITDLNNLMQGAMGSTMHQRLVDEQIGGSLDEANPYDAKKLQHQLNARTGFGVTAVGGLNEDLDQRGALGSIPGEIVQLGLFIVDKEYQLGLVQKELEALYEVPSVPVEITAQN